MLVEASGADAERIARLHVASWQATYAAELSEGFLRTQDVLARATDWRRRIADGESVILAIEAGELAGFVASGPSGRDGEWEIYNLHVTRPWQGRGLGGRLFDATVARGVSAGAREVVLWVVETNGGARAFYERQGMGWDGSRQRHPVSPDEALVEVRYRMKPGGSPRGGPATK